MNIIFKILNISFIKNTSVLMTGTIISQILNFVFSLILTRLFSENDFGHFAAIMSVASVLSAVSTLSYEKAILLVRSNSQYRSMLRLILFLSISINFMFIIAAIILYFSGHVTVFNIGIVELIYLLPILSISMASVQIANYVFLHNLKFNNLAILKIVGTFIIGASQCALAFWTNIPGLVFGTIVGNLIYLYLLNREVFRFPKSHLRKKFIAMRATARKFYRFPRYLMPNELIDNISNQIPLFIIGHYFSLGALGQYALASRILSAPAVVLGQAVSQIFFQKIMHDTGQRSNMMRLMLSVWGGMALIGVVPFAIVFFYGTEIFIFVFGKAWADAGQIAAYSSILIFFRFVSSPTSSVYIKLGMQREGLYFCIFALMYRTLAFMTAASGYSIYQAIIVHSICEIIFIILYNLYALRRISQTPQVSLA
jgi:O-antigen/teichoic acid export membrane protein